MPRQLISMPIGSRLETRSVEGSLMFNLSGAVSIKELLVALGSAWLLQIHKQHRAAVIDATDFWPTDQEETARGFGRQMRYTLRGIPRVPVAVVLRMDTLEAGRFAAYEMAFDGRLMGAFTELSAALSWVSRQTRMRQAQAHWQAAILGQPRRAP